MAQEDEQFVWWKHGVIYQIYPRSFQDTSGNGVGDLNGILRRLDYLAWLGVDAIWISPMYPSPMHDFGYDVADYVDVDPLFGSLADMDAIIAAAHKRGMKIILDFVPNHSSWDHPWFVEAKSSKQSAKRDWYIWRDPAPDGGPPNNWISHFGGKSAWEFDEASGQYYFHLFLKEQPDLNWRNPAVREAMADNLRFWFERGVDGFRVDVAHGMMKDPEWRDAPINPAWSEGMDPFYRVETSRYLNHPDVHLFNRWQRSVADEYDDRMMVGETYVPIPDLPKYYGEGDDEYHLAFNFHMIEAEWGAAAVKTIVNEYDGVLPDYAWPNYALGNHDRYRVATRAGIEQARVAMMLLLTLRGTPTMYYGDELGMQNVAIPPELEVDPWGLLAPGIGLGRDPVRTPMQWDASENAGFSSAETTPWLPISDDYKTVNVASQKAQPNSMLNLTQQLLKLRRASKDLTMGDYREHPTQEAVFAYFRGEGCLVGLNFSAETQTLTLPSDNYKLILTTYMDHPQQMNGASIQLRPNEGILLTLT